MERALIEERVDSETALVGNAVAARGDEFAAALRQSIDELWRAQS